MHAVVHLPRFPLQVALRHAPDTERRPAALVDPGLSTPRVVDADEAARALGVCEGLTPTQALARVRDLRVLRRSPVAEQAASDALLQAAYGFSPHLEATAPGTVTLDLRGLPAFPSDAAPDPVAAGAWAGRLRDVVAGLGFRSRVGLGGTPGLARHAARWAEASMETLPGVAVVTDPGRFLAGLPVGALEPSADAAGLLADWGVRTVGDLLGLGQAAVAERLGLEAFALFAAASTTATRPLRLVRPIERFVEGCTFDPGIETLEPLLFRLRRFVDSLEPRLAAFGWVAQSLHLRLELEDAPPRDLHLRLPEPTRQADILFRGLHTALETVRAGSAVTGATLTAEPTRPVQRQFGLFEAAVRDPHQLQETLTRLAALVGADRVGTPVRIDTHRPDTFRLVPPDFDNAPAVAPPSPGDLTRPVPVRRFRPPLPASVTTRPAPGNLPGLSPEDIAAALDPLFRPDRTTGAAAPTGRPILLRCALASGRLPVVRGPWRADGDWWDAAGWAREEWDVVTSDGRALRLAWEAGAWRVEAMVD